jgi:probable F420-dependent oxidoreductase
MRIGLGIPHTGPHAAPNYIRVFCQRAEVLGYHSLWALDHVVMPPSSDSLYTLGRRPTKIRDYAVADLLRPNYESTSTLLFVSGFTTRVRLGTSVAVLPLRNPLLNGRMLATLDAFSGGRLTYGVGVGWLREEAEALQMPWDRRGARTEEHIALLRHLWTAEGPLVSFDGDFYRFGPIDPEPRPVQHPPPILIGGHSDAAVDRAGRIGDGWIAALMSPARLGERWARVVRAAEAAGRPAGSVRLHASVGIRLTESVDTPVSERVDAVVERIDAYATAGVDELTLTLTAGTRDTRLAAIELLADHLQLSNDRT